jgi:hypothetical protein
MAMSTSDNWKWICLGFAERHFDFIQTSGMHQSTKTQNKRLIIQWLLPFMASSNTNISDDGIV